MRPLVTKLPHYGTCAFSNLFPIFNRRITINRINFSFWIKDYMAIFSLYPDSNRSKLKRYFTWERLRAI